MNRFQNIGWRFLIFGVIFVICAALSMPAKAALLAAWEFNPGDVSGSGVAATGGTAGLGDARYTGVLQADAAVSGGTLQLDGSGDYLQFGNNLTEIRNMTQYTLAAWVNPNVATHSPYARIVEHEDNYYFWINGNKYRFEGHADPAATSTTSTSAGTWQHVVATYSQEGSGPTSIYVNGAPAEATATGTNSTRNDTDTFQIGARRSSSGGASNFLNGQLDDVAVFGEVLSNWEIDALAGGGVYANRTMPTALAASPVVLPDGTPNTSNPSFQVWLKADAGVYKDAGVTPAGDGDAVVQWNDQTGNNHNATRNGSNGDMTFETAEIGTMPSVSFSGGNGDDHLQIPTYTPADNDDLTVFVVAKADTQTSGGSAIRPLVFSGAPAYGGGAFAISTMRDNSGGSANLGYFGRDYNPYPYDEFTSSADASNFGDGAGHVVNLVLSGAVAGGNGTFTGYYDGLTKETHNGSTSNPANGAVQIGGDPGSSTRRLAGDMAEILIYDKALSSDDRLRVTDYLNQKYGFVTPSDIPGNGLMLYATMNNFDIDATTVYDRSGNNRNGTLQNGLTESGDPGQIYEALHFEGGSNNTNSEYVDLSPHVGDFAGLGQGTISAWIKSDPSSIDARVILAVSDKDDASSEARLFLYDSGGNAVLRFDGRNDGSSIGILQGTTDLEDGGLHHVAVTVDSSGLGVLYVDGVNEDIDSGMGFFSSIIGLDTMGIGRNKDSTAGGGQWFFDGLIDDMAIWNRPLTTQEVQHIYVQGLNGKGVKAQVIPEPSSLVLWSLVAGGALALVWRRRRVRR